DGVPDRVEAPRLDLPARAHARGVPVLAVLRVLDADPVGARLAREQVLRAPGEARALAGAVFDPGEAPARVVAAPLDEAGRVLDQRARAAEGLVAALGIPGAVDDAHDVPVRVRAPHLVGADALPARRGAPGVGEARELEPRPLARRHLAGRELAAAQPV